MRTATTHDAPELARLHADRISEGFLPTLGRRFLARLYRRIVRSPRAAAYVVEVEGHVVGFAAGTTNVGAFYKEFLVRDGVPAGLLAAPHCVRAARRIVETLRYPAATEGLPDAEVLAVASARAATGRGYGARSVRALTTDLARRGADAVKVTVADDNDVARRMYHACGFRHTADITVHGSRRSEVLTWAAS